MSKVWLIWGYYFENSAGRVLVDVLGHEPTYVELDVIKETYGRLHYPLVRIGCVEHRVSP